MTIQVNPIISPRIITIPEADGHSITIQTLCNQIRNWEDNQANLAYSRLLSAAGKEDLGGGVSVGITATLENTKLKFADRSSPTVCTVSGGNLVAIDSDGYAMSPIEHSAYCTVLIAQSSSAVMIQDTDIGAIRAKTDNLPSNPAIQTTVQEVKTEVVEIKGAGWSNETLKEIKDLITQIKVGRTIRT